METSVNNKCGAFTSLEQSKKLAEILPSESADMIWVLANPDLPMIKAIAYEDSEKSKYYEILPAWSLAALLEQLDDEITDEEGNDYNLTIVKESLKYQLYYHDSWGMAEDIETDCYDDMVDACFEMIIKLHELNLL